MTEVLHRGILNKTLSDILYKIFVSNHFEYPDSFDKFGSDIAEMLLDRFDKIEANPKIYASIEGFEALPMEINKYINVK